MWWLKWIGTVVQVASPEIVTATKQFARDLRDRAKETSNPVDDILTQLLCVLLHADEE